MRSSTSPRLVAKMQSFHLLHLRVHKFDLLVRALQRCLVLELGLALALAPLPTFVLAPRCAVLGALVGSG